MACGDINGLSNACGRWSAGVKNIYIAWYHSGVSYASNAGVASITGATFKKYEPAPNSCQWDDNATGMKTTLGRNMMHTITAFFAGNSTAIRNEMMLLSDIKMLVVVQELDGLLYLLAPETGMWMTTNNYTSRKSGSEGGKGYEFTAEGESVGHALTLPSLSSITIS